MHSKALEILSKIEEYGFKAYIVGGYVRDYYMKKESSDIDICTNAKPKDLISIFEDAILPKDMYGAVTLKYKNVRFEITTFRKELEYVNRKPVKIEYIDDLYLDIERRDFTINSLCMDLNGNIIDLFGGRKDIHKKTIKSLGNAKNKFYEDPLRILRAIRFATTLNFNLDKEVIDAIKENRIYLRQISYDRKKSELNKIFASKNIKYGITLLKGLEIDKYLDINLDKIKCTSDILGIWAQLNVTNKYQFNKIEKNMIADISKMVENKTISKYDIYKYGLYVSSIAAEILGINKQVIVKLERNLPIHSKKEIDITTDEIIKIINKEPGAWLNKLYEDIETKIINLKLKNENNDIIDYIIKNYI